VRAITARIRVSLNFICREVAPSNSQLNPATCSQRVHALSTFDAL